MARMSKVMGHKMSAPVSCCRVLHVLAYFSCIHFALVGIAIFVNPSILWIESQGGYERSFNAIQEYAATMIIYYYLFKLPIALLFLVLPVSKGMNATLVHWLVTFIGTWFIADIGLALASQFDIRFASSSSYHIQFAITMFNYPALIILDIIAIAILRVVINLKKTPSV